MSDFVRETIKFPDGSLGTRVRLDRLTDGRVMCCICFEYTKRENLARDEDGDLTDVCKGCGARENLRGGGFDCD